MIPKLPIRKTHLLNALMCMFLGSSESLALTAANIDSASITDPKAKAAAEVMAAKLSTLREYTCTISTINTLPKGQIAMTEQLWAKGPKRLVVQQNTAHLAAALRGSRTYVYDDGNTVITHTQPAPGAAEAFTKKIIEGGKTTLEQARKMAEPFAKASAQRYDMQRLRSSPGLADVNFYADWLGNPFHNCDMATLRLDGETTSAWHLSSSYKAVPRAGVAKYMIAKADGTVRRVDLVLPTAQADVQMPTIVTVSNILLNPPQGIPDATFNYTPPAGVTLTDGTDQIIEASQKTAAKP